MTKSLWAVLAYVACCGCGAEESAVQKPTPRERIASPADGVEANRSADSDLEIVRKWLAENLDDGKWEDVRWWSARDSVTKPTRRLCRLKYRTKNRVGATQLYDQMFDVSNGSVLKYFGNEVVISEGAKVYLFPD